MNNGEEISQPGIITKGVRTNKKPTKAGQIATLERKVTELSQKVSQLTNIVAALHEMSGQFAQALLRVEYYTMGHLKAQHSVSIVDVEKAGLDLQTGDHASLAEFFGLGPTELAMLDSLHRESGDEDGEDELTSPSQLPLGVPK